MKDPLKVISEIATSITLATSCRSHDHTFIFYPYCLDVESKSGGHKFQTNIWKILMANKFIIAKYIQDKDTNGFYNEMISDRQYRTTLFHDVGEALNELEYLTVHRSVGCRLTVPFALASGILSITSGLGLLSGSISG